MSFDKPAENLSVVQPFLEVITHSKLLGCLSVDPFVGTIYSFLGGTDGTRAINFVTTVCQSVFMVTDPTMDKESKDRGKHILSLAIETMRQLLEREMRIRLNEQIDQLFTSIDQVIAKIGPGDLDAMKSGVNNLRKLVGRCARLTNGPTTKASMSSTTNPTFPLQLPQLDGQHDNQYEDITKIRLFPTTDEIMCDEAQYLPSTNWTAPHIFEDPVQRHLDTHFRLLRHDLFGSINKLLHGFIHSKCSLSWLAKQKEMRARGYSEARLQHIHAEKQDFEITVSFLQPEVVRKLSLKKQRQWWEESSRLEEGTLVAFLVSNGTKTSVLFFVVASSHIEAQGNDSKARGNAADKKKESKSHMLSPENGLPRIVLKLVERTKEYTKLMVKLYDEHAKGFLIELPSVIPATFVPILGNLQKMIGRCELLFSRWILPREANETVDLGSNIPPPVYARSNGFKFQLATITKDGEPLELDPASAIDHDELLGTLELRTGLDRGQCEGLWAALTREYALIQGPPGTGKSYVGVQLTRALLASKERASLGPILVICYTNHALDQFLEHLIEVGVDNVIRIGGRSRLPKLEGKNLREMSKQGNYKTKMECHTIGSTYDRLDRDARVIQSLLRQMHLRHKAGGHPSWGSLKDFLQKQYSEIYNQLRIFESADQDGFTIVGGDPLTIWLRGDLVQQENGQVLAEVLGDTDHLIKKATQNIHSLAVAERRGLTNALHGEALEYYSSKLASQSKQTEAEQQKIKNVHRDVDIRILRQADIIGVTTTGLARDIEMLRLVGSKVVICEEAAEVLEAHLLSALMPGVQHLIQIGDHQQLRPQILDYSLSMESSRGLSYQLNRSQFERRAVGEPGMAPIPLAQLNIQRRARPEISRLYRIPLYPNLKDHENVSSHPNVVGMRKNLFWLEHNHKEDGKTGEQESTSKTNKWEVDMVVPLVRHLVRQGLYAQSDIAVLTPYAGQLRSLRLALNKEFDIFVSDRDEEALAADLHDESHPENAAAKTKTTWDKMFVRKSLAETLRLATVDNFQGEEAKIIIVSLVRGNLENKVGFLRTSNRINVLLSRAKHGMYIIGNSSTYLGSGVQMWTEVYRLLEEDGGVGPTIGLCCERHRDTPIECSKPEDFHLKSPEGGCTLGCDRRLDRCGHRCMAKCHPDSMHKVWHCPQPCSRTRLTCSHSCAKLCGDDCGPCLVELDGVKLPCGHTMDKVPCYQTQDVSILTCKTMVDKTVAGCEHTIEVTCATDVDAAFFSCPVHCEEILPCGHGCPGQCGSCNTEYQDGRVVKSHRACSQVCRRPYSTCSHACGLKCHGGDACGPCSARCVVRCPHSACGLDCNKPCTPCIEPCVWHCEHQGKCPMPCAAPCERLPCNERCTKTLKCGHRCPSICGEECRQGYCHDCGHKEDSVVDYIEFKKYAEIDVDETPVVVLSCGHIFTAESLDGHVGMHDVYLVNQKGEFTGLKDISSDLAKPVPGCPECRRPIRQFSTKRYNRVINRVVMDETTKRLLAKGRTEIQALESEFQEIEKSLQESRDKVTATKWTPVELLKFLANRHAGSDRLISAAKALQKRSGAEHQPAKKLSDAIERRRPVQNRDCRSDGPPTTAQHSFTIDKEIFYGAAIILYKMQDVKLRDTASIRTRISDAASRQRQQQQQNTDGFLQKTKSALESCAKLVQECTAENFPRAAVQLTLCHAHMTKALGVLAGGGEKVSKQAQHARALLEDAGRLCKELHFGGAEQLGVAVEETLRLFVGDRYEELTPEELDAIKSAMVSGPGGIATHSGHWYKCLNGHPFAIGECGMPMELARCPECGTAIGGQGHRAVAGVERADEME